MSLLPPKYEEHTLFNSAEKQLSKNTNYKRNDIQTTIYSQLNYIYMVIDRVQRRLHLRFS